MAKTVGLTFKEVKKDIESIKFKRISIIFI